MWVSPLRLMENLRHRSAPAVNVAGTLHGWHMARLAIAFGGSTRFSTATFRSGEYPTSSSYPAHLRNRGKVEQRTTSLTQGGLATSTLESRSRYAFLIVILFKSIYFRSFVSAYLTVTKIRRRDLRLTHLYRMTP